MMMNLAVASAINTRPSSVCADADMCDLRSSFAEHQRHCDRRRHLVRDLDPTGERRPFDIDS